MKDEEKRDYIKIDYATSLEDAMSSLYEESKRKNRSLFADFNGFEISSEMTLDEAYVMVHGMNREEYKNYSEEFHRNLMERVGIITKNRSDIISYWIGRGEEVLNKEKFNLWRIMVKDAIGSVYGSSLCRDCLEIVELLDCGKDMDEIRCALNEQDHTGASIRMILHMVRMLSSRGEEFSRYVLEQ